MLSHLRATRAASLLNLMKKGHVTKVKDNDNNESLHRTKLTFLILIDADHFRHKLFEFNFHFTTTIDTMKNPKI